MIDALLHLLACIPFAAALIHVTPALDGEATRRINKIEDDRLEALAWLAAMEEPK